MTPQCLICGSTNVDIYLDETNEILESSAIGSSRTEFSPGRIMRCGSCGFAFRESRFNQKQLADLYRKMDPKVYQAELRGRDRTAELHLEILNRSIRGGQLFDVGCASGLFLSKALDAGWQVTGIEPSEVLYREAVERLAGRGTVLPLTLEEADLGDQKFDAITLWDVLEHVVDPMKIVKTCRELLKPGGCLFVNVPDLDSLQARVLGKRWPLLLPEHMNYFNRGSLKLCAEKSGLHLARFGRRRSYFSVQYVLHRCSQHRIPAARLLSGVARTAVGRVLIPISLGETYAVFQRPLQPERA